MHCLPDIIWDYSWFTQVDTNLCPRVTTEINISFTILREEAKVRLEEIGKQESTVFKNADSVPLDREDT